MSMPAASFRPGMLEHSWTGVRYARSITAFPGAIPFRPLAAHLQSLEEASTFLLSRSAAVETRSGTLGRVSCTLAGCRGNAGVLAGYFRLSAFQCHRRQHVPGPAGIACAHGR